MHLRPDPDFQDFALDCIRLSNQEKSPRLRHRLLTLAREWMHAAMHQRGAEIQRESTERMDANSGEPWSDMDISDLTIEIAHGPRKNEGSERGGLVAVRHDAAAGLAQEPT
jgi:hypothetical protein